MEFCLGSMTGTFAEITVLGNVEVMVRQPNAIILPNFLVCCIRRPHRGHNSIFIRNVRGPRILRTAFRRRNGPPPVQPPRPVSHPQVLALPFQCHVVHNNVTPDFPATPSFAPASELGPENSVLPNPCLIRKSAVYTVTIRPHTTSTRHHVGICFWTLDGSRGSSPPCLIFTMTNTSPGLPNLSGIWLAEPKTTGPTTGHRRIVDPAPGLSQLGYLYLPQEPEIRPDLWVLGATLAVRILLGGVLMDKRGNR